MASPAPASHTSIIATDGRNASAREEHTPDLPSLACWSYVVKCLLQQTIWSHTMGKRSGGVRVPGNQLECRYVVEKSGRDLEIMIQSVKTGFSSHPLGTMNIEGEEGGVHKERHFV